MCQQRVFLLFSFLLIQMNATIKLAVTNDLAQISLDDLAACAPRFNQADYSASFFASPATLVKCGTSVYENLTHSDSYLVRSGKSCPTKYFLENVGGTDKCGRYH